MLTARELELLGAVEKPTPVAAVSILPPDFVQTPYRPKEKTDAKAD